jgi:hypothetical protein
MQRVKLILLGKLHDAIAERDYRYADISVQKSILKDKYELDAKLIFTVKLGLPEGSPLRIGALAPPSSHCHNTQAPVNEFHR